MKEQKRKRKESKITYCLLCDNEIELPPGKTNENLETSDLICHECSWNVYVNDLYEGKDE